MEYEYTWSSYKTPQDVLEFLEKHRGYLGHFGSIRAKQQGDKLEFELEYDSFFLRHPIYKHPTLKGYMLPDENGCTIYANEVFNKTNYFTVGFTMLLPFIFAIKEMHNNFKLIEYARFSLIFWGIFLAVYIFCYLLSRGKKPCIELM